MHVFGFEHLAYRIAAEALKDVTVTIQVREHRMAVCAFVLRDSAEYFLEFALQFKQNTTDPLYLGLRIPLFDCIDHDGRLKSMAIHVIAGYAAQFAQLENIQLPSP